VKLVRGRHPRDPRNFTPGKVQGDAVWEEAAKLAADKDGHQRRQPLRWVFLSQLGIVAQAGGRVSLGHDASGKTVE